MKIYIIILYVVISLILCKKYIKYEDYKNEPYITVIARFGLNNKLHVLLSYLYKANKENKKLKIIWHIYDHCPERFDNLFEPIDNVEIIYVENDIKHIENDYNTWSEENWNYIKENYYSLLKPLPEIQEDINNTKEKLGNNYIACHLRRTDGWNHRVYIKDRHTDEEYMEFIDQYPRELNIYIATDNQDTQQKFIDLYGDRIIYKKIDRSNNLRQTSLQDAVKDMYICAGAKYFMGSPWSSFTDSIYEIRKLNK